MSSCLPAHGFSWSLLTLPGINNITTRRVAFRGEQRMYIARFDCCYLSLIVELFSPDESQISTTNNGISNAKQVSHIIKRGIF